MNGAELIAAERTRQVEEERWTPDHDDDHDRGELRVAAACYALPDTLIYEHLGYYRPAYGGDGSPHIWPWEGETYRFECCGARHHLAAKGGAKNWLAPDPEPRPAGVEGAA